MPFEPPCPLPFKAKRILDVVHVLAKALVPKLALALDKSEVVVVLRLADVVNLALAFGTVSIWTISGIVRGMATDVTTLRTF